MNITIAYLTNRRTPKLCWFLDALTEQGMDYPNLTIDLIVVDFCAEEEGRLTSLLLDCERFSDHNWCKIKHVTPYPNPYQGRLKIPKDEWFNAAAARNTAICLCRDDHIVFADDLSCPAPGWLSSVLSAIAKNRITLGTYHKVMDMKVSGGRMKSFKDHPTGHDHRLGVISNPAHGFKLQTASGTKGLYHAPSEWLYGCSLAMPIEPLLQVGGFLEAMTASMGYEDCAMSRMLSNNGHQFFIDINMMTYESEELHHGPGQFFRRRDPLRGKRPDGANDDMSHALLDAVATLKYHPNNFDPGGIRELRRKVLAGEPFPERRHPQHCWWTGEPLEQIGEHWPR